MTEMPPKPQTHNGDIGSLPPALARLRGEMVWVCWRWFWSGKKWTKPPRRVDDPSRNASTSDSATWGSYEQAVAQVRVGKADGIGFALKGRNIGGIDLDHCRDPVTGQIEPWADDYIRRLPGAYVEATVSGNGLRILGTSKLESFAPKFKLNAGNGAAIELFSNSHHYLTLSCNEIGNCTELPPIGETMASIEAELGAPSKQDRLDFDASPRVDDAPPSASESEQAPPNNATPWSFAEEARLRAALDTIPTDEKVLAEKFGHAHNTWVKIGRAIERLDWGERGYAIFRDWSAQNAHEFDENGLHTQWASFNRNRKARQKPTTVATIYLYAIKCGWSDDQPDDHRASDQQQNNDQQQDDDLDTDIVSDLEMCGVDWLWPGRFARGKFGLIAGMPDMGKGQIAAFITAVVTASLDLPCDEGNAPQGSVIWFNAEDGARDTVKPRLIAAAADTTRVHIVKGARVGGEGKMFSLVTDLPLLRKAIERIGNVVLVIIDPVSAYLGVGKVDSRSATDVRGVLTPLKEMAEELHIAVIGIAHFNKKDDIKSALLRVSDSIAYVAAARHVYAVLDDPDDKNSKLFIKAKNNLAPDTKALRYGFGVKTVGRDPKLGVDIDAPYIVWHPQHVEITANEAMQAGNGTAKREAREFLLERLEAGPVNSDDLVAEAKQEGITFATLRRAKKDLGIKSRKQRGDIASTWTWELPPKKTYHPP
jgi:AAA domain/Primase C terminal 2 (PriCT-2)